MMNLLFGTPFTVSTHSRPKAAGATTSAICAAVTRFNSQPPEGGWFGR